VSEAITHKQVEHIDMWFTSKALINLLEAESQKAAYLAAMGNPPFASGAQNQLAATQPALCSAETTQHD
jgi:hypothetical protein